MFSDSLHDIIQELYEAIKHYNEEPFNYTEQFYTELLKAIQILTTIMDGLDHPRIQIADGTFIGGPTPQYNINAQVRHNLNMIFYGCCATCNAVNSDVHTDSESDNDD